MIEFVKVPRAPGIAVAMFGKAILDPPKKWSQTPSQCLRKSVHGK